MRIGLDVGAVFLKVAVLEGGDAPQRLVARRHQGNPVKVAREALGALDLKGRVAVGVTGSNARLVTGGLNLKPVDFVQAEIEAVRRRFPGVRNILNVGGGSVTLIQLDEQGRFLDYTTNSLCAAGTGSFLDQQAHRLGIAYEDLERFSHHDDPPAIATRCSVFAKTDLIHRQQEGFDKSQLWCGLCKGLTSTFLNTLLRGRPLRGLTVLTGGVSLNREVMHWLRVRYGEQIQTWPEASFSGAIGAACLTDGVVDDLRSTVRHLRDRGLRRGEGPRRKPLRFVKSHYPSFDVAESYVDAHENEVRVTRWPEGEVVEGYLGIDVGSTSTKLLLIDREGEVLVDVYRRTAGAPIEATKRLFAALQDLADRKGSRLEILGAGTTGSGRKLIGKVIGADLIINEITAHLTGALSFDPEVDTIFEIGGQDSKYIRARRGQIYDSNMNYVCAAGTGSFIEEQAKKLGFDLAEIGDTVMGIAPPITSDRCTVFMEQDVDRLIREGYTREECIAAVLCSVVQNYFNKVVGQRHTSRRKIFFQGATARNKGLVAAFENLLDVEMVVSPYCHVMGALGAALLVKGRVEPSNSPSRFKGLDLSHRKIALRTETCRLCENRCTITFAEIEGESDTPSWGYMCGREPGETRARMNREFEPFRRRLALLQQCGVPEPEAPRGTIGLPRALHTFSLLPRWRTFFHRLGYRLKLSPRTTNETVARGLELTAADFCFPIKIAHGHAAVLDADPDVDFVFLPHVICNRVNRRTTQSYVCPFVQAAPSVIRSTLALHGVNVARLLRPVVDLTMRESELVDGLHRVLGPKLDVDRKAIAAAWRAGQKAQAEFESRCAAEGRRILKDLQARGERAIVLLGRPYNTLDLGANLSLPRKIAELGMTVIPLDLLPYRLNAINPAFGNMYWHYGQHILCAAEFVRTHPGLFAVYFTNFSCGPDSFLLSFVEEVMGEKPILTLEIDEHGGDAGYMTRVEAFLDVVRSSSGDAQKPYRLPRPDSRGPDLKARRIWVPNMHPVGTRIFASVLRGDDYDAQPLPPEDPHVLALGKSVTRGSECLPATVTTGSVVRMLREQESPPETQALFMPTASGPCRFGQYCLLQRMVLNRIGYRNVQILSPSGSNAYLGLSQRLRVALWRGIVCSDILYKCRCKLKPYETIPGRTDEVLETCVREMEACFQKNGDSRKALAECVDRFREVPVKGTASRLLVGIVGEIYVRCNPFCNAYLVEAVERMGGEAWLAPLSEWILYTAEVHRWKADRKRWNLRERLGAFLKNRFLHDIEQE